MSASRKVDVAHEEGGLAPPEEPVLGDAADKLLTALMDLWDRIPLKKRCSFGVERGIKLCTVSHAARPRWHHYGTWDAVEELAAAGMVHCRTSSPSSRTYPLAYVLCDLTPKGQAYVRTRYPKPTILKRMLPLKNDG